MKAAMVWNRLAGLAATPLTPSHYLALFRPLARGRARVEAVTTEVSQGSDPCDTPQPAVATLTLRPGQWAGHVAGQHVRVGIELDGRIATRCYSISSSADRRDGCFTITVKAQGRVSRALTAIAVGSYVTVGELAGDFVLPREARLLFVTGGSGVTPIMSMLRTYAGRRAMPDIAHVHFARSPDDVIIGAELAALAAAHPSYRLHVVVTGRGAAPSCEPAVAAADEASRDPILEPAHDPAGVPVRPRFTRAFLDDVVPDWATRTTLACGPAPLLAAAAFTNPRVEHFTAAVAAPPDATGGRVRFNASRTSAISDGRTPLLRITEDAGIAAPHGCRMGICHTCDVTLTAGCVRDLRTGQRIDEPGARIQTCVCAAAGDVELAL